MRSVRTGLTAVTVSLILALAFVSAASATSLSIDRAKRAISTKAYLTNGANAVAYGARSCRRLSSTRVSCQAYVERSRRKGTTLCTDRMTAVQNGNQVRILGAASPPEWRCREGVIQ